MYIHFFLLCLSLMYSGSGVAEPSNLAVPLMRYEQGGHVILWSCSVKTTCH